jgi:putative FmdB family regulatory protein
MPLYEYRCDGCQKIHEVMQKFSDAPLSQCPECKGPVQKLLSMSSFALKGTGWYTTDYKRKGSSDSFASSPPKAETKSPAPKSEIKS